MNRIEKDICDYFGISYDSSKLVHYGTKRHSGRYPWGSGETPYQHSGDFLSRVEEFKSKGLSERETLDALNGTLPKEYQMSSTEFRVAQTTAKHERRQLQVDRAKSLREDGLGATEIGKMMGLNESTVRSLLNDKVAERKNQARDIAAKLKEEVDRKGMVDVGKGAERTLGVSEGKLKEAIYILEAEDGYQRYGVGVQDPTNSRQQTTYTILATPDKDQKYAYQHQDEIDSLGDYHYNADTDNYDKLQTPSSLDSSRVTVRYGDEGGLAKDGVIEIRRGVEDLSLGNSHYAQVRIQVDGTHYLKGMAVYSDDIPDGYDIVFNTNKKSGTPMMGSKDNTVLKPVKDDPQNPFGAAITAAGQRTYIDADGNKQLSPINKLKWEGMWDDMSKTVSSQFLSKQPLKLIKQQLNLTIADYEAEYDTIMHYTNPTIKRKMLQDFADRCDGNAMTLKASMFPGQSTKVILPITSLKENECYAPTYEDGTKVALVRYPHAGTFEIPMLTVNNKNRSGKNNLGNVQDAIGINSKVAERLSGADFDGDTVMVIPVTSKVAIKSTPALEGLKDFDPKTKYAVPEGNPNNVKLLTKDATQKEMGVVSNLITDMTLRGAPEEDMVKAVKHSMVVIDAAKHGLDYKQSEKDNEIDRLKQEWQIRVDDDGNVKYGGASTLLSRRKQEVRIPERQGSGRIDKNTGELIYKESGREYIDEKGKKKIVEDTVSRISITKDVHTLSSGTPQEELYADFANKLKNMANQARKESLPENAGRLKYSKTAAETYADEVKSLNNKLAAVELNAPKERKAKIIANANIKAKIQALGLSRKSKEDKKQIKKISSVEMERARQAVGARSGKTKITFTDREWEAIQAGAISDSKLMSLLDATKDNEVVKRAMPKQTATLRKTQTNKAKQMLANGYSYAEIAEAIGVPKSTIYDALNK